MRLPLILHPKQPLAQQALVSAGHALAAAVLWPIDLPIAFRLSAMLLLLGSAWVASIRLRRNCPLTLILSGEGRGELEFSDGRCADARIMPGSTVWPRLVVIRFDAGGRPLRLAISADMLPAADFRQLRVLLRWAATPALPAADYS